MNLEDPAEFVRPLLKAYHSGDQFSGREDMIPIIRKIQSNALRWAFKQSSIGDTSSILIKADQLDPNP